ncbi:MAG: hypothetical protein H0U92_14000 [Actinobacteria bacterium]|nr:hypothetical protein [Actinomycetota bacterium]
MASATSAILVGAGTPTTAGEVVVGVAAAVTSTGRVVVLGANDVAWPPALHDAPTKPIVTTSAVATSRWRLHM